MVMKLRLAAFTDKLVFLNSELKLEAAKKMSGDRVNTLAFRHVYIS